MIRYIKFKSQPKRLPRRCISDLLLMEKIPKEESVMSNVIIYGKSG